MATPQPRPVILVTGASGLLGANFLHSAWSQGYPLIAAYHGHPLRGARFPSFPIAAEDPHSGPDLVLRARPQWIIHCAAATDVDWCENNPAEAFSINAGFTRGLAAAARRAGSVFVYISTDAVFDGSRGLYSERDLPSPVNTYGRTKLAGEEAVREEADPWLIIRTNIFGWNLQPKTSLAEWVLARLSGHEAVPGFQDVTFSPLLANALGETILDLLRTDARGLFHAGASDSCTKYEFARLVAEVFGYSRSRVTPASIEQARLTAPRPRNTSLDSDRVASWLGRQLPTVRESLEKMRELREHGYLDSLRKLREDTDDGQI